MKKIKKNCMHSIRNSSHAIRPFLKTQRSMVKKRNHEHLKSRMHPLTKKKRHPASLLIHTAKHSAGDFVHNSFLLTPQKLNTLICTNFAAANGMEIQSRCRCAPMHTMHGCPWLRRLRQK